MGDLDRPAPREMPEATAILGLASTETKDYNSRHIRRYLRQHGIKAIIPRKSNQRRLPQFDREGYRERNRVESFINRLKQFRRVATRSDKRAIQYLAIVTAAAIMAW
jgi:transposase